MEFAADRCRHHVEYRGRRNIDTVGCPLAATHVLRAIVRSLLTIAGDPRGRSTSGPWQLAERLGENCLVGCQLM